MTTDLEILSFATLHKESFAYPEDTLHKESFPSHEGIVNTEYFPSLVGHKGELNPGYFLKLFSV